MRASVAIAALAAIASLAAGEETPICAERPTKANAHCTVPAQPVQVETGLVDWSRYDRSTRTTSIGVSTNKSG